ncbi:MAG: calcium-binding protein [Xanthobacteraceae bacterium]
MTIRKWGSEQLVNTNTTGLQEDQTVAALPNGGFVVVWHDNDAAGGDGDSASIKMQRYDAFGNKAGGETLVNTTTVGAQLQTTVTLLSNGDFAVAWRDSSGANGTGTDIRFRRFEADGEAVDLTDRVLGIANTQVDPDIAPIAGSGFIVAYLDTQSGTSDIHAQRFDAAGAPVGGVITVAGGVTVQTDPAIATLNDGSFAAVWLDNSSQIVFQRIDANGALNGGNVTIADAPSGPSGPDVLALANGGFLVSWSDSNQGFPDNDSNAVRAQLFDASGNEVSGEFTVNTLTQGFQNAPSLVALPDGGFVAVYRSADEIRGQAFDAVGNKTGPEFLVNTSTTGIQRSPTITVLADGRLLIAWTDNGNTGGDTSVGGVRMQIIDMRDGSITGTENGETLFGHDFVSDEINGLGGSDTLNGLAGADAMYGGQGDDTYVIDNAGDGVFEGFNNGTDTVQSAVSFTLGDNVERLTLTGSAVSGTGNALANILTGNAAANVLNGLGGSDSMAGLGGNDTYIVGAGDTVTELAGGGADLVSSTVSFVLGSNVENLTLTGFVNINGVGNTLANVITGNSAVNVLRGSSGNDTLRGGLGNDPLFGDAGNDVLNGDAGNDATRGGTGNDTLNGGLGNDPLLGESGNDLLDGDAGRDTLTGGANKDTFRFDAALITANRDKIVDFSAPNDTIQLENSVFKGLATGKLASTAFHTGTAAHDANDRVIYNKAGGTLLFDADGTGSKSAIVFATIAKNLAITNADFFIT